MAFHQVEKLSYYTGQEAASCIGKRDPFFKEGIYASGNYVQKSKNSGRQKGGGDTFRISGGAFAWFFMASIRAVPINKSAGEGTKKEFGNIVLETCHGEDFDREFAKAEEEGAVYMVQGKDGELRDGLAFRKGKDECILVTTRKRTNGAAAVFLRGTMRDLYEAFGGDYYIVFPTRHLACAAPADEAEPAVLKKKVGYGRKEDFLTYSVFYGDGKTIKKA